MPLNNPGGGGSSVASPEIVTLAGLAAAALASPDSNFTVQETGQVTQPVTSIDGHDYVLGPSYALTFGPYNSAPPYTTDEQIVMWLPLPQSKSIILNSMECSTIVFTTNDATHYYGLSIFKQGDAGVGTGFTTIADTADFLTPHPMTADLPVLLEPADKFLYVITSKVGTPGGISIAIFAYVQDVLETLS